jgi:hypothetical protein
MKSKLQLSQVKEALSRSTDSYRIIESLKSLYSIYAKVDDVELYNFVPIKIIACFEDYFRCKYQEIIDNPKYRINLNKLVCLKNITFDFDVLAAFQDKHITLGDYIAYFIPCNKLGDIETNITELLGINFIDELEKEIKSYAKMMIRINEIFETRHIFCHEVPAEYTLKKEKILNWLKDAISFLESSNIIIYDAMYPNAPQTQAEMNEEANKSFDSTEKGLNELIKHISSLKPGYFFSQNFSYIADWKKYRKARAIADASLFEDGSIYSLIYLNSMERTTKKLITDLKKEYKSILK